MGSQNLGIVLQGEGVSNGIVQGTAKLWNRHALEVEHIRLTESLVDAEVARFMEAVSRAEQEISDLYTSLVASGMKEGDHLGLLDAHKMMLRDPMIINDTQRYIREEHLNAEWALSMTLKKLEAVFAQMSDPFFRERGQDVSDIGERLMRFLQHPDQDEDAPHLMGEITAGAVLVAGSLSPTEAIAVSRLGIAAFVLDTGSGAGHTAIIARSLGIPAVVGLGDASDQIGDGDTIIVDGFEGEIVVHPSQYEELLYGRRAKRAKAIRRTLQQNRLLPARTPDGMEVILRGNLDFTSVASVVGQHGGDGIGLYRTEFLFLGRQVPPTEEEQYASYSEVALAFAPQSVTIRTLDIGGDKEIKYLGEDEKGQGLRAIRWCLKNPDFFLVQLRALLRAAVHGTIRLLLPFVTTLHELREAKRLIAIAAEQLTASGTPFNSDIEIGIMIEVPAAALAADTFAREVDFMSVGTNDLMQYTMAVSRAASVPDYLKNVLQPGFLRLLQMVTRAAHAANVPVAMCGEMASKPRFAPILLALGFDELSMTPTSIPLVKEVIRRTYRSDALALFQKIIRLPAEEAKDSLESYMVEHFPDIVTPRFRGAPHYMR